jgi:hypothetical protein
MRHNRTHRAAVSRYWIVVAALFLISPIGWADEGPPSPDQTTTETTQQLLEEIRGIQERLLEVIDARDQEIAELRARLAELEAALLELQQQREQDDLDSILAEADRLTAQEQRTDAEAEAQRESFVGRERNLQAMNPEISFLGDVSYDWSDSPDIQDGFVLRGAELAFQAALDPYTRFKAFLAGHEQPPILEHEHEEAKQEDHGHEHSEEINLSIGEAYVEWVALPFNTRLRVGKFRQQFGTLNRWHLHALPTADLPFALRNIFGHHGQVGLGVGLDWQLPRLWASANGLTLEVVNADNPTAFAGSEFDDPAWLLRHTGFFDLGPDAYLELGLNGMIGPNGETETSDTTLAGVDLNFIWEPTQRAKYRSVEFRGEYIHARYEGEEETVESDSLYAYLSWKFARRWIVGVRYDNAELPYPEVHLHHEQEFTEGLREEAWSPYLTFWQSEFVRLRLQYQYADRDFEWAHGPDDDHRLIMQATFAAGPHKHESY